MTEILIIKTELLSYLATATEHCSSDIFFKAKNLTFIGRNSKAIGRVCG